MKMEEVVEILSLIPEIDFENMGVNEHILFISAAYEFTEKVKPLIIKNAAKNYTTNTFLMRLGED